MADQHLTDEKLRALTRDRVASPADTASMAAELLALRAGVGLWRERAEKGQLHRDDLITERDKARARVTELEAAHPEPATSETSDGHHTFAELYRYRMLYNAALFNEWARDGQYDVHKSWRHSDGEKCFGGDWFVVYAQLPSGQISNHYEADAWEFFRIPERETAAEWDGHTPGEVATRLAFMLRVEELTDRRAAQQEPIGYVVASNYDGETNLAYDGLFPTREEAETAASRALGQRDRTVHPVLCEVADHG